MNTFKTYLLGKRTLKTAVAVFLTALICQALKLPVIFAVIAAIVTVEPTVNASIRKGLIRLPAAAIGAALAMFFDAVLGQVPAAYALSSFFTIVAIHRLGWNDALIVATLTAVNMINFADTDYLLNFLTRLGTTSIGIVVSTLVNFIMFRPNFMKQIEASYPALIQETAGLFDICLDYALHENPKNKKLLDRSIQHLTIKISRLDQFIRYQLEDDRYFRFNFEQTKRLKRMLQKIQVLRQAADHAGHLLHIHNSQTNIGEQERVLLKNAWTQLSRLIVCELDLPMEKSAFLQTMCELSQLLHEQAKHRFNSKSGAIALELLATGMLLSDKGHFPRSILDN